MRRKLESGRGDKDERSIGAAKALRLTLARVADDLFGLPLAVIGITQGAVASEKVAEHLEDDRLLIVLDGQEGTVGAASVSLALVAAIIQQQTMGRVLERAAEPRPFTSTDAAMCAPVLDALLGRAADLAQLPSDKAMLRAQRYGARAEDARSLALALAQPSYRVFSLTLDIALGKHQGALTLLLPDAPVPKAEASSRVEDVDDVSLNAPMMQVTAELTAVLCKLRMPLAELNALKPGDLLPLTRNRLHETSLVTVTGRTVAQARLGQLLGNRAVRLAGDGATRVGAEPKTPAGFELSATTSETGEAKPPTVVGTVEVDLPDLPGLSMDDPDLSIMSAEEAAAEISELAGLDTGDWNDDADEVTGRPV
ncbi:FliM/FliN family flagellar motor switch protein [Thalassococcus sp. S3]|uniref:FliM/FliN family flagellar motor switch protein n=1 Tax=Thalassococcus sp. S3 TaxID=2017482 RepID=UPI0010240345|nr:FliM/FliN family flagellar motor C-terminal domain-containing protein [Thalassococcus sp. S3]QBF32561.1 hypothetical protein CFI11_15240 [Thalassococcus sp. S3]